MTDTPEPDLLDHAKKAFRIGQQMHALSLEAGSLAALIVIAEELRKHQSPQYVVNVDHKQVWQGRA